MDGKIGIPRIIHYCWFGGNNKPKDIIAYMKTWKEVLPDYSFIEWNEDNFDINTAPDYVKEAYKEKKYAFVSDYVRIKALYEYGGIYFDTDVEVLRPFDQYFKNFSLVLGFESDRLLTTAFIACHRHNQFIGEFLNTYKNRKFIYDDGSLDTSTINEHFSDQAERWGVDLDRDEMQNFGENYIVYPREIFCGFDVKNWHIKVTENTCVVHHMASSWVNSRKKLYFATIYFLQKMLGYRKYDKLKALYDRFKQM